MYTSRNLTVQRRIVDENSKQKNRVVMTTYICASTDFARRRGEVEGPGDGNLWDCPTRTKPTSQRPNYSARWRIVLYCTVSGPLGLPTWQGRFGFSFLSFFSCPIGLREWISGAQFPQHMESTICLLISILACISSRTLSLLSSCHCSWIRLSPPSYLDVISTI